MKGWQEGEPVGGIAGWEGREGRAYYIAILTDTNLATKTILLHEGPKCKNSKFDSKVKNTEASFQLLIQTWTTEQLTNTNGTIRKRDVRDVPELAEFCALVTDMLKELQNSGMFTDETLAQIREDGRNQSPMLCLKFSLRSLMISHSMHLFCRL